MAYSQIKLRLGIAVVCYLLVHATAWAGQQQVACTDGFSRLNYVVFDSNTRLPLTGALVTASWRAPAQRTTTTRTDSTGRAALCIPEQHNVTIRSAYRDHNTPAPIILAANRSGSTHTAFIDVPGVLVRGRVLDQQTNSPVPQVSVRMGNTRLSALTDTDGRFQFLRIPVGDYDLRADHIAYAGSSTRLNLRDDDVDALVWLAPAAIPLQPIVVTAFSRRLEHVGFYERQKRGVGTFISRKQIDAMNVHNASDLLRASPSLRLVPQPRRANNQLRGRRGNCRFTFIVDGARTLTDFEMDNIAAYAIEGIELYNGLAEVPAVFRTHAPTDGGTVTVCGVIAIWTRNSR